GWSWLMYSKRRSSRAPGSIQAPCAFQFVFTMQNAEPHDAPALPAKPAASTANSSSFFMLSPDTTKATRHGASPRGVNACYGSGEAWRRARELKRKSLRRRARQRPLERHANRGHRHDRECRVWSDEHSRLGRRGEIAAAAAQTAVISGTRRRADRGATTASVRRRCR